MEQHAAYHIGIVVPNIGLAMEELTEALGLTWASEETNDFPVRNESGTSLIPLSYTYSIAGPPHIELMSSTTESSMWSASNGAFVHHIGFWADDLPGSSAHLEHVGMALQMTSSKKSEPSVFAYHQTSLGFLIELVDSSRKPGLHEWLGIDG